MPAPSRGRRLRTAATVAAPAPDDDVLELDEPITEGPTLLSDNAAASTRERLVISNTNAAFANYRAALLAIESNEIAVAANTLALEGTRAEQTVGTRNVLDVLNAEQELLNSQVLLVTARRDAYVAGFQLLNAMGQAEAEDLNLDGIGPLYDPTVNYNRYSRSWNDWDDGPTIHPSSTRTAPPNNDSPVTEPPVTVSPQ